MIALQWVRFVVAAVFFASGMLVFAIATVGIFRLDYVLNRIHVAAKCDTLGMLLVLSSLIIMIGFSFMSLKMLLIIIFLWLANPVSGHLISRLEVTTGKDIDKMCEIIYHDGV